MTNESFNQVPLDSIIPSYAYFQYADDESIQAFISAYNSITQSYLNWFVDTPLSVYTSPAISGLLLDWIGQGLYGYERPFLITGEVNGRVSGGYGFSVIGKSPYGKRRQKITPGTATVVSDDVYKRALTWHLYLGDGKQMTIQWMKRRLARFLYGVGGGDIPVDDLQNISIQFLTINNAVGYYGSHAPYGRVAYGKRKQLTTTSRIIKVTLPNIPLSVTLQSLINGGFLAVPFQAKLQVNIL